MPSNFPGDDRRERWRLRAGPRAVPLTLALLLLADAGLTATPARAQVTRADTAAVLLDAARTFQDEGRLELAEQLLAMLAERYGDTDAGRQAGQALTGVQSQRAAGRGHAGYVVWSTIFGAWMGVAIPAAFGADQPEPFGLGLLVGTPTAFFASRAYGASADITVGASRTITLSWMWGTWQALGWRAVLDLGRTQSICGDFGCSYDTDPEAPWIAAVVGGLTGYAAGIAVTRAFDMDTGTAELLWHSSIWGTGYGFALGFLADLEDDELLASTLVGGNVGLLGAIPAAQAWKPSSGKVRLVSVAGLAGAVAGLGVDLLLRVDDEKTAVAIPTVGATLGLIGGSIIVGNVDREPGERDGDGPLQPSPLGSSLLRFDRGWGLGVPLPLPVRTSRLKPDGTEEHGMGVGFTLFEAAF